MNRTKLNGIVEYIRMQAEFPFDVLDVDEDLDGVLGYFGFFPRLEEAERAEVKRDIDELAEAAEFAEIARLVAEEEDGTFIGIGPESGEVLVLMEPAIEVGGAG